MKKELTIKQDDFWRLLNREQFLLVSFNARLQYRIPATNNQHVYVHVHCDDKTIGEHAEQYILSFLEPKHIKAIPYPPEYKQILCDDELINRLMKEYLVHIEIEDKDQSHTLIFHSSTLTVLFLAIDDFRKAISNVHVSDPSMINDTNQALGSISTKFEIEFTTVDEEDRLEEEEKNNDDEDEQQEENSVPSRIREPPAIKTARPGADSIARRVPLDDVIVQGKKRGPHHHNRHHNNPQPPPPPPPQRTSDVNNNPLVHEMRQKLKGRNLRDVVIDGANIGRTYGDSEFSAYGIKLAVDLFQSYGYSDSKIVVIVPAHYLSKDKEHVFPDLIRRKILHKAFAQKIDDKNKRFYDDRLIVDIAVMRNGVILSNDFYRDLLKDSGDAVGKAIRERLLCYRFVGDNLCLPNPVSEGASSLDDFLSM